MSNLYLTDSYKLLFIDMVPKKIRGRGLVNVQNLLSVTKVTCPEKDTLGSGKTHIEYSSLE